MMTMVAVLLAGAPYPDALDALRAEGVPPRVTLILDSSCSMNGGTRETSCTWFAASHNNGKTKLNKNGQMRAALVGCQAEGDGVLDRWDGQVEFAVVDFRGIHSGFESDLAGHKGAVIGVPTSGGTPLSLAQKVGGQYHADFATDANTPTCTSFFQVLLSDGDPNGGATTYDLDCTDPVERLYVASNKPWLGSNYLRDRHPDVLCNLSGDQTIATYTLGFGSRGSFTPSNLQNIASLGGGDYFYASEVPELIAAFDAIIATVAAKGRSFAQAQVPTEGFFSANRVYLGGYVPPRTGGPWHGNLRRVCLAPPKHAATGLYRTDVEDCFYRSTTGTDLVTNPGAKDAWSGAAVVALDQGGVMGKLKARLGGVPKAPYYKRNLLTWRPGQAGWVPVHPDTWQEGDARAHGCARHQLLNFLHGYAPLAVCVTGEPVEGRLLTVGASMHAPVVELRYGPHCEVGGTDARGCYVVRTSNEGMVQIVDARSGEEISAFVPGELWSGRYTESKMADIFDQPSARFRHRYFVDGDMRLDHDDRDGDGIIDDGESAQLLISLGRGGRIVYALDVSEMSDGLLDAGTPIRPVAMPTAGTPFERMASAWRVPVPGRMMLGTELRETWLLVTGHEARFDVTEPPTSGITPIRFLDEDATMGTIETLPCDKKDGFAAMNGMDPDVLCQTDNKRNCKGTDKSPCYDGLGLPLDISSDVLGIDDPDRVAAALRFHFSTFDLGPGDFLIVEDALAREVARYTAQDLQDGWTNWVYGEQATLRLITDGVDSANRGYVMDDVEWEVAAKSDQTAPNDVEPPQLGEHRPALLILDPVDGLGAPFGDAVSDAGVRLEVAASCTGSERCLDARDAPDLAHMVCALSQDPAVYWEEGQIQKIYLGDECGQIFLLERGGAHASGWTARRLVSLNDGPVAMDKDHRKIFTRMDVVESTCPGEKVVGLYFGTGNVQRPLARDELEDPAVTDGRDVVGVLWHGSRTTGSYGAADFVDVTGSSEIDPEKVYMSGKVGWMLRLEEDERMLSAPLVVDGRAYFRTFQPVSDASGCTAGSGLDRIYVVDNCSAKAVGPTGKRSNWSTQTDGTSGMMLSVTPEGGVVVSHGDLGSSQDARLGDAKDEHPGLFLWRGLD